MIVKFEATSTVVRNNQVPILAAQLYTEEFYFSLFQASCAIVSTFPLPPLAFIQTIYLHYGKFSLFYKPVVLFLIA